MSTKIVVENLMVHIGQVLSVWLVALMVGWVATAVAGPTQDLLKAALDGDAAAVKALLAKGADVNAQGSEGAEHNDGLTALMVASQQGRPDVVQALLAKGADVNAKSNDGGTALSLATDHEVRALLLQAGANQ
jgi:uncharacterized protein